MEYGWGGRIVHIDLSAKSVNIESTDTYKRFIGGRGINQWLLFNMLERVTDPLGPENAVILGAGPLIGTMVPGADRLAVDFKNVITGGVGSGNSGSQFAAEMKFAGYDHIVIKGKADRPVYIYINNERVYLRDAAEIWGRDTWETDCMIKQAERDNDIKILSIGIAGENLVKYACIISDRGRAVGYGGSGAVFGSKNLKAVAVRGTGEIRVADPEGFMNKLRQFNTKIEKSRVVGFLREGGTLLAYQMPGEKKPHGVRNMSEGFWPDNVINKLHRHVFDKNFLFRRHSCFGCPVYCSGIYQINGMKCEGVQANTWRAFASNLDIKTPETVLEANTLVNLLGLDTDQTSAAIGWAIECYENGILDKTDTGGLELKWGNDGAVIRLIKKIAVREDFGDILADGVYEACRRIGRGSDKYSVLVKKNSLMEAGMRSHKAWALGIVTSTKGGGHLRGAPQQEMQRIPPELSKEIFDIDDIYSPVSYENKADLVLWHEKYKGVVDMMGICALITMWNDISLFTPEDIAEFYCSITGDQSITADKLMYTGERLQNLEKAFNILHAGFDRKDDIPPRKLTEIPVKQGQFTGERLELSDWNKMLDEYYLLHGWDISTGWPTRKCLTGLGLGTVVQKLEMNGIYLI